MHECKGETSISFILGKVFLFFASCRHNLHSPLFPALARCNFRALLFALRYFDILLCARFLAWT